MRDGEHGNILSGRRITITDPTTDRYNAFNLISWWRQEVLEAAHIAVLGAGAVGNEVIKNLALMGVGHLFNADFDTIERANLTRSILFRQTDEGEKKAEVAARAAHEINPDVHTQYFHGDVTHDLGLGVLRRMNAVICCLDSRHARTAINTACMRVDRPMIDGGLNGLYGEAKVFWRSRGGACYECTLNDQDYKIMEERMSCQHLAIEAFKVGRVPTTPTGASMVGAIEAQEALKILHGMPVRPGFVLMYDGLTYSVGWYEYSVRDDCPAHSEYTSVIELPSLRASTTTIGEFLEIVRQREGRNALLELDFEFVTELVCGVCGRHEEVMKPIHKLTYEQSMCCGTERRAETFFLLNGSEPFAHKSLAELGVPPLAILRVLAHDAYAQYELSGDAGFLHFA